LLLGGIVAATEFLSRSLRSLEWTSWQAGTLDKHFGGWRWSVAGSLFLAGTLLRLIGTFD
jgi:hypothetical protein